MFVKYIYRYSNGGIIEGCTQHHNHPGIEITPEIKKDNFRWYTALKPKNCALLPFIEGVELTILTQTEVDRLCH